MSFWSTALRAGQYVGILEHNCPFSPRERIISRLVTATSLIQFSDCDYPRDLITVKPFQVLCCIRPVAPRCPLRPTVARKIRMNQAVLAINRAEQGNYRLDQGLD